MWTRKQLKDNAKSILSKYYWTAFAVTLVTYFAGGYSSSSISLPNFGTIIPNYNEYQEFFDELQELDPEDFAVVVAVLLGTLGIVLLIFLIVWVIWTVFKIFVTNPLVIGKNAYFIRQREDCGKWENLICAFRKGKYKGSVKTMFFYDLYIFLWSLLFYIPGIIKKYSYFMVPYILADNPEINTERAFEISKKAMDGNKWNVFVLDLSFILWHLGCICTCGLGYFFFFPYWDATRAELYACLKSKAMQDGIILEGELPRSIWNGSDSVY